MDADRISIPAIVVPREPARVKVKVNDIAIFDMVIDTGSTATVVSPALQQTLKLPTRPGKALVAGGGEVDAPRAMLTSIEIVGFPQTRVNNLTIRVMEIPFVVDGALGCKFAVKFYCKFTVTTGEVLSILTITD